MLSTAAWTEFFSLLFENQNWANIGDATGLQASSTAGSFYVSLHTASPGIAGNQTTNEATYTPYARVAVARSTAGWTASTNTLTNDAAITFATQTSGTETVTHWGIGTDSSGAGNLVAFGAIGSEVLGSFTAATDDTITIPAHSLVNDDRISFQPNQGDTIPTGITAGTVYWVLTAPDADNITVSATQDGGTLDITAAGSGIAYKHTVVDIGASTTPEFAAGALDIYGG